jgi:hypothetical protein
MRLNEFEELNLAVNFHDELNPRLWDNDRLQPEVREALLRIAEHFKAFLGIDLFDLVDITISGSNAAYTYTSTSDIDLHLVVMIPDEHEQELKELFNAKKYQYNDQHNIQIRGYDVELYVQDAEDPHHSMGIYSIMRDRWVSQPKRQRAQVDDIEVQEKYKCVKHRINQVIVSDNHDNAINLWKSIKNMRQSGLEQGGEFSPENLAFKILRADGSLDKLRKHMGNLEDAHLGLKEAAKTKFKPAVYLDMDGVLADFFSEFAVLAGLPPGSSYRDIPPAKGSPTLDAMIGTDFFARLPKCQNADAVVAIATKLFGGYSICSSPLRGDHKNSEMQKKIWIRDNLNPQPNEIIITPNKAKYATQPDGTPNILIDDRGSNITGWEGAGGIGIKYQADEDSINTIMRGMKRAFEIIRKEREHEPQQLTSINRDLPVATPDQEQEIREDEDTALEHKDRIMHFIKWVYAKERIKAPMPHIRFASQKETEDMHHTGWFNHDTNEMFVYTGNRNLIDILRTVAHELRHVKQGSEGRIHGHSPPGSKLERDADGEAGYLMKLYGKMYPEIIQ